MSVSCHKKLPPFEVMKLIMKELGFENSIENCMIHLEEVGENRQAINVLEIIKGSPKM